MIKAIYKRREDGEYDFVAAFETKQMPPEPSNWPDEVVEWLNAENEITLIVENIDLCGLPDVLKHKATSNVLKHKATSIKAP